MDLLGSKTDLEIFVEMPEYVEEAYHSNDDLAMTRVAIWTVQGQLDVAEQATPCNQVVDITPHLLAYLTRMQDFSTKASAMELIAKATALEPSSRGTATSLRIEEFFSSVDWDAMLRQCETDSQVQDVLSLRSASVEVGDF